MSCPGKASRPRAALLVACLAAACERAPTVPDVRSSGYVEATEIRVATKVAGRVADVPAAEGDRVAAGTVLARIDPVDLELALAVARGEQAAADAELRLRLAGARAEEVAEAEALVATAEADRTAAERDLGRAAQLLASGSGTPKARDDALARRDAARGRLDAARERLRRLRTGTRPEEIDAARARLAIATARVAQIEQQVRDTTIASPAAGVVTEQLVEPGEVVPAGAPVALVVELGDPWLNVYVAEPDLSRVRIGQPAEVVTDDGQRRSGRVTFVASEAEFTPKNVQTRDERVKLVFKVKVALPNDDGLFKPGMPAEAILATGTP